MVIARLKKLKKLQKKHSKQVLGAELPEILIKKAIIKEGIKLIELLSSNKMFSSKSEVRRAVKGGAIKLDNKTVVDEK